MFLVAFYDLFRIGELASKSTRSACSVIQYSNLTFSFGTTSVGQLQGAKISIHQYKHNVSQRPFDILLARDVSSPFAWWQLFSITVRLEEIVLARSFVSLIWLPFRLINSMLNFCSAYLIVVSTQVGTKAIVFVSVARAMQLSKDIPMCKSVLLVVGNQTHLKFT